MSGDFCFCLLLLIGKDLLMENSVSRTKVLFVCNQNKVRSLTAEHLYRARPDLEVRSAGTASFAKTQLSRELLNWSEVIFVFEKDQITAMTERFEDIVEKKRIICLGLPDKFEYKSPSLVVKLVSKLDPYLGRPDSPPKYAKKAMRAKNPTDGAVTKAMPSKSFARKLLSVVGLSRRRG